MNIILFDDQNWINLLPLTFTRPICELRCGIVTIREKWEQLLKNKASHLTQSYLNNKYTTNFENDNYYINGSVLPNAELIKEIKKLDLDEMLIGENTIVALHTEKKINDIESISETTNFRQIKTPSIFKQIKYPWDIFTLNDSAIKEDVEMFNRKKEQFLPKNNNYINESNIFIEKDASMQHVTLNASKGPIYIGKGSEIMEGSVIRGPFVLCDHSVVKLSSKIYGATTIGPHSKVGGELNNVVIQGYSNKAHDGFLGNAVIGEWCNIGADSNNSNLKNNYAMVKVWNYKQKKFIGTGLQFCGLIMADHSKCGINTMFNTGTVVGVGSNIFGSGFPRNFVPSFSWGGAHGFSTYKLEKFYEVAEIVMNRRGIQLDETNKNILLEIFDRTSEFRK